MNDTEKPDFKPPLKPYGKHSLQKFHNTKKGAATVARKMHRLHQGNLHALEQLFRRNPKFGVRYATIRINTAKKGASK